KGNLEPDLLEDENNENETPQL
ncbi:MAG: hypothetical protein UW85_C0001G0001, partial [Parcubacteria group bacterium GW2011_GWA1_Parcubacteria_45_10]